MDEAGQDLLDEVGLLLLQGLQDQEIVVPDRRWLVLLSEQSSGRIRIPEKIKQEKKSFLDPSLN